MPCPICQGGGDRYACSEEGCVNQAGFACARCIEVYNYTCPDCGGEAVDLEGFDPPTTTNEPLMERDEVWQQ